MKPVAPVGSGDPTLARVGFAALPGWSAATAAAALPGFRASCRVIMVMPEDQTLGGDGIARALGGKAGQWRGVCAAARAVPPGDPQAAELFYQTYLTPYRAAGPTRITGYFEPVYAGSEVRLPGYDVPLYGRPRNLAADAAADFRDGTGKKRGVGLERSGTTVPYPSRARIVSGAIAGHAAVIAWLRDPVDAYMAQVQGAARIRLPDRTLIDLGFDGTNGRAYTPIGKLMVEKGDLAADDVSIQSISTWLRGHPARARALMDANRNYVFFRRARGVPDGLGTPGALGVPLTPEASVAVDEKAIPLGAPVFLATATLDRLATAQDIDVGADGTKAAQLFIGIGRNAAQLAGGMDALGALFVLLPHPMSSSKPPATGAAS